MTVEKGVAVSNLMANVGEQLTDSAHITWPIGQLLSYLNDGVDNLAADFLIRRKDVVALVASKGYYPMSTEIARVEYAKLDGLDLIGATEDEMTNIYGDGWREEEGTPKYFLVDTHGVRLVPIPGTSGTAITEASEPPITENNGVSVLGLDYFAFTESSEVKHFLEGDGTTTDWPGGTNQLVIMYSYMPRDCDQESFVPLAYRRVLTAYMLYRAFNTSDSDNEKRMAGVNKADYDEQVLKLERRMWRGAKSASYIPKQQTLKEF